MAKNCWFSWKNCNYIFISENFVNVKIISCNYFTKRTITIVCRHDPSTISLNFP
jgi:hypothetical protein